MSFYVIGSDPNCPTLIFLRSVKVVIIRNQVQAIPEEKLRAGIDISKKDGQKMREQLITSC